MRRTTPFAVLAALLLLASTPVLAGSMTLTRAGALYRVTTEADGLTLWRTMGDSVTSSVIPQTAGITPLALQVGVDPATETPFVLWQESSDTLSQVLLAYEVGGQWTGPIALAGDSVLAAMNPAMLIHREVQWVEEGDELIEVATTFLHIVYWSTPGAEEDGTTVYLGITLDEDGEPLLDEVVPIALSDLLPYGIGCHGIDDAAQLAHPKLFIEPETGDPHILATDFPNCLFLALQLADEVSDPDPVTKRRRHAIVLGRETMIAIKPDLPLGDASFKVGHGLTVAVYWDREELDTNLIEYTLLDEDGWTDTRALVLDENLRHEQAVELISNLTR
jgi:hypothetical protein